MTSLDILKSASDDTRALNPELFGKRPLTARNRKGAALQAAESYSAQDANLGVMKGKKKRSPKQVRDDIIHNEIVKGLSPRCGETAVEWNDGICKIILWGERPFTINAFYSGVHHSIRHGESERVKDVVQLALFNAGVAGKRPFSHVVSIQVGCYMTHPAYDTCNPSVKSYIDALQGLVIKGDDLRYVDYVLPFVKKVQNNPRVEITVGRLPWSGLLP